MDKLVFGCGYLGFRVARRWQAAGLTVHVVTRSPQRASQLARDGFRPIVADVTRPDSLVSFPLVDTILFAVGFDRAAGYDIQEAYVGGLQNVLAALDPTVVGADTMPRFIYISSTGVHGQADGSWIDERSACEPIRAGGRACLAAERLLNAHALGRNAIVLRLAGIYGPGRIPRRSRLQAGEPILAAADGYLNLIHVDDAARAVTSAANSPTAPQLYLVSDGNPVVRRDYYAEVTRLLRLPDPVFRLPTPQSPAAERARGDKRIRNTRLLEQLPFELEYPTYREGLASIVDAG